jgi:hypothetical protein
MVTIPIEERLWRRVTKGEGCWEWSGSTIGAGYGMLRRDRDSSVLAHRLSWELAHGPIPEGMKVCHSCDNPPCVNPEHLFLGTQADNMADMAAKKRHKSLTRPDLNPRGERNPGAKLTAAQAGEIRAKRAEGIPQRKLARDYGVSEATVSLIVNGKRWTIP